MLIIAAVYAVFMAAGAALGWWATGSGVAAFFCALAGGVLAGFASMALALFVWGKGD